MPSLLLVVFLVELAIQIVNSLGAATISNGLWSIYTRIPATPVRAAMAEHRLLQRQTLEKRRALQNTSSQDQFAKWARLRREHDQLMAELEKKKAAIDAPRRRFDTAVTTARIALTRVPQYVLPFWYAREPMFWLPHGWFPAYAEWVLAFPRAPRGSVSIASWQLACTAVVLLLRDVVLAVLALVAQARQATQAKPTKTKAKETPVAAEATTTSTTLTSETTGAEKKEQ